MFSGKSITFIHVLTDEIFRPFDRSDSDRLSPVTVIWVWSWKYIDKNIILKYKNPQQKSNSDLFLYLWNFYIQIFGFRLKSIKLNIVFPNILPQSGNAHWPRSHAVFCEKSYHILKNEIHFFLYLFRVQKFFYRRTVLLIVKWWWRSTWRKISADEKVWHTELYISLTIIVLCKIELFELI